MRVVQFHLALVDFFSLLFKDIFVTTMFSQQCRTDPQPILYNTRDLFKWIDSFCLANGCYSKVTAWILLSYALSLLPHFGHSYNKTESLQFTSAFCQPTNISLEIENSDFPKEYSLYVTRHLLMYLAHLCLSNTNCRAIKGCVYVCE